MKVQFRNATVEQWYPDDPVHSSECFMLASGVCDDGANHGPPCYEFFRATFVCVEDGDCDTGPSAHLEPGPWEHVGSGMGYVTLEDAMARYHEEEQEPEEYSPGIKAERMWS